MSIALVTNVRHFGGPGSVRCLAAAGFTVVCHDASFTDKKELKAYVEANPKVKAVPEQEPAELIKAVASTFGSVDVLVSNDIAAPAFNKIEDYTVDDYRDTIEGLQVRPFAMANAVVPQMKKQKNSGKLIFIVSAVPLSPWKELPTYASARTAATTLVVSLGKELGQYNIPVFGIGPNYLSSEDSPLFYPTDPWETDPAHIAHVKRVVGLKRMGTQQELGELVAFLASGKCDFITGQMIWFCGGWPMVERWPGMAE